MACMSLCRSLAGVGAIVAVGSMLSGAGFIGAPRNPKPPAKQPQPSIVTPRRVVTGLFRLDGVDFIATAQATRYIGGAPLDTDIPATNNVQVILTITRADGKPITREIAIPTLVCTQGGVTTNVVLEPVATLTLVPNRANVRQYSGVGNVAWADDVLITGQVRVQGVRGAATTRIPVPMQVIALP